MWWWWWWWRNQNKKYLTNRAEKMYDIFIECRKDDDHLIILFAHAMKCMACIACCVGNMYAQYYYHTTSLKRWMRSSDDWVRYKDATYCAIQCNYIACVFLLLLLSLLLFILLLQPACLIHRWVTKMKPLSTGQQQKHIAISFGGIKSRFHKFILY